MLRCLANSGLGTVHHLAAAGARLSAPHGAVFAAVFAEATDAIELSDEEVSEIVTRSHEMGGKTSREQFTGQYD